MAAGPLIRKIKSVAPFDRLNPSYAANVSTEEKRRRAEQWEILNNFVTERHGWIVSPPGKHVRIEVRENSGLPIRLAVLGYKLRFCGTGTRLVGGGIVETITERGKQRTVTHAGPIPVEIIEVRLK
jgi:hypothetical protein